jgi:hypothetical protein
MDEARPTWTEEDSRQLLDYAGIAVPGRDEQMRMLLSLVPAQRSGEFTAAELACGEKRRLFRGLVAKLEPGGGLIIAGLVQPPADLVRRAFAEQWDGIARAQSRQLTGSEDTFRALREDGWNAHALEEPAPGETPSRLFEQLKWLEEAGLTAVDCFWMRAGLAIYGGYR